MPLLEHSKIRIAIVVSHPIQYWIPLYRELSRHLQVEVLFCHEVTPSEQATAGFGVEFEWDIPLLEGYQFKWIANVAKDPGIHHYRGINTPELSKLLTKENYDIVLVNGWNYLSYHQALFYGRINGLPVLCRGDSQAGITNSKIKKLLKRIIYPIALRQYSGHLYPGERNKEYLLSHGVKPERLFKVAHFVDTDYFAARARQRSAIRAASQIRKDFGIPAAATVFMFVGKFIGKKRPLLFIEAIHMLNRSTEEKTVYGILVGDGPLLPDLQTVSEDNGSTSTIRFAGFQNQSQLPAYYLAADCLVLPSDGSETWGLVVNEAMACGTPAVVSNQAGCAPDMIREGITGYRFDPNDPSGLVRAMSLFLARCDENTANSLSEISASHSVATATSQLLQAISKSVNNY